MSRAGPGPSCAAASSSWPTTSSRPVLATASGCGATARPYPKCFPASPARTTRLQYSANRIVPGQPPARRRPLWWFTIMLGGRQTEAVMSETTGGEETSGIGVSDAEREAVIGRLSAAAGDGRLTLEEFSQRMELATAAGTRADLDSVIADLPADA